MSYTLKVIQDNPIAFWPLDETSGSSAYDISGCGNHSSYIGGLTANTLPIVLGGISGTKITNTKSVQLNIDKNFYGIQASIPFGISKTEDNSFSLEAWFKQNITTTQRITIIGDSSKNIGLFYQAGKIIFLAEEQRVDYILNEPDEVVHIVGIYEPNNIKLYINGGTASGMQINNFSFTNQSIDFKIGPTNSAGDSFIIDAPAIYRYALLESQAASHYRYGTQYINPLQITKIDGGTLFTLSQTSIKPSYSYSYKDLNLENYSYPDYLYYDENYNYLAFSNYVGSNSYTIEKEFFVPSNIDTSSSKIEWRGKTGITVQSKVGNGSWETCINGEALPQFKKGLSGNTGLIYIKIIMESNESLKINPKLTYFNIDFFSNKNAIAENSGDQIYSETEYDIFQIDRPVLLRTKNNGLHVKANSKFKTTQFLSSIYGLELFYTPYSLSSNGGLFNTSGTKFEWKADIISKSNINKIYVNGVDKTSATFASSLFENNNLHHVFIIFSSPVADAEIIFNNVSDGTASPWTESSYKNISFYKSEITSQTALKHYSLYIGMPSALASGNAIALSQPSISTYSNDWIVLQSI